MLLATALALLITGCTQQTLLFKTNRQRSSTRGNHHHHFFVSGIGQKKTNDAASTMAQKMLLKQKPANIRKWIARFYYFRHLYSAGGACVLLTIIAWVAHRYGQLYLHYSLIYFWVPSSCFCIVINLTLWGEIIPFSGVCQSGGGCIIHAGGDGGFTLTDRLLRCATDDDQRQHHHGLSLALASVTPSCIFASSAAASRWRICMSMVPRSPASVLWHFCRAGLCR